MFGYVLPRKDRLSEEQAARYHAAYCGLCRSLKEQFGFKARFLVNYDMVFLYFLLHAGQEESEGRCHCPARMGCCKPCITTNETLRYVAELSVLLSCWKLRDACADGKFRPDAKLALWLYRKSYRRAAERQPQIETVVEQQLAKLSALEQEHCASLDRASDAFATLLCAFAAPICAADERRAAELLLYHTGRYLYLVDALEDLPGDAKKGSYNPLIYRFGAADGCLKPEERDTLTDSIEASISLAASALELLPEAGKDPILRNIIYLGLPAVLRSVSDGTFRKRHKRSKE